MQRTLVSALGGTSFGNEKNHNRISKGSNSWVSRLLAMMICGLCGLVQAEAQFLFFHDVRPDSFPIMRASALALDSMGRIGELRAENTRIFENGRPRPILSIQCDTSGQPRPISVHILLSVNASMITGVGLGTRMDAAARYVEYLLRILPNGSEIGVQVFYTRYAGVVDTTYLYTAQEFTANRTRTYQTVAMQLPLAFDTTNNDWLPDDPSSLARGDDSLNFGRRARYDRLILLLRSCDDELPMLDQIYAASLDRSVLVADVLFQESPCPRLSGRTRRYGGREYQLGDDNQSITTNANSVLERRLRALPCTVEWLGRANCSTDSTTVSVAWQQRQRAQRYPAPVDAIQDLAIVPTSLFLGGLKPGVQHDTTILIRALDQPVNIGAIEVDGSAFQVSPQQFTLAPFDSIRVSIRFTPTDSSYVWTPVRLLRDSCPAVFFVSAGFPGYQPRVSTLRLQSPNGGEKFVTGSRIRIEWAGISPADSVALDFSSDAGRSWTLISRATNGRVLHWTLPDVSSDSCLIRVRQGGTEFRGTDTVRILRAHGAVVNDVAWSPNGQILLTASDDNTLRTWDLQGRTQRTFQGHPGGALCAEWSPDAKIIASGGRDFSVQLRSSDGQPIDTIVGNRADVTSLSWSPDGRRLAASLASGTFRIWQMPGGLFLDSLRRSGGIMQQVAFSPNGTLLAAGVPTRICILFDLLLRVPVDTILGLSSQINGLDWSPDGTRLAFSLADSTVALASVADARIIDVLPLRTGVSKVAWSPSGTSLAIGCNDSTVKIYDVVLNRISTVLNGHTGAVRDVDWNRDGLRVASASADRTARIWMVETAPLQSDLSDRYFSIVAPRPVVRDIDMGNGALGDVKDSVLRGLISNTGSQEFTVDSIVFRGVDSLSFQVRGITTPFLVKSNTGIDIPVRFIPVKLGLHEATYDVFVRREVLRRTIRGTGTEQRLKQLVRIIDFGSRRIGRSSDSTGIPLVWNPASRTDTVRSVTVSGADARYFQVTAPLAGMMIGAQDTIRASVQFRPETPDLVFATLTIEFRGGDRFSLPLFGSGEVGDTSLPLLRIRGAGQRLLPCQKNSGTDSFVIESAGTAPLRLTSMALFSGAGGVVELEQTSFPITLPPGASQVFGYSYSFPVGVIDQTIVVRAESNDAFSAVLTDTVVYRLSVKELSYSRRLVLDSIFCPGDSAVFRFVVRSDSPTDRRLSLTDLSGRVPEQVVRVPGQGQQEIAILFVAVPTDSLVVERLVASEGICPPDTVELQYRSAVAGLRAEAVQVDGIAGQAIEPAIRVFNSGSRPLTLRNVQAGSGLVIQDALPIKIAVGGTVSLRASVTFSQPGQYSIAGTLLADECGARASFTVPVHVRRNTQRTLQLVLDTILTETGKEFDLVVRGELRGAIPELPIDFTSNLVMNAGMAHPVPGYPGSLVQAGQLVLPLRGMIDPVSRPNFIWRQRMKAALGDDSASAVVPQDLTTPDSLLSIEFNPGRIVLTNLCREGGIRLLSPGAASALLVTAPERTGSYPRVVASFAERGHHRIALYSIQGDLQAILFDGNAIQGSLDFSIESLVLGSGVYYLVLTSPSRVESKPFIVQP